MGKEVKIQITARYDREIRRATVKHYLPDSFKFSYFFSELVKGVDEVAHKIVKRR